MNANCNNQAINFNESFLFIQHYFKLNNSYILKTNNMLRVDIQSKIYTFEISFAWTFR